jgi:hypothetical protein
MRNDQNVRQLGAGLAVGAAVLAPLLTVTMPFRPSLVAQAVINLSATLVLLAFALLTRMRRPWSAPPRVLLVGVALYAAAALQGGVVAVLRGNDLTFMAGQLLSMALLPLAAVGAFGCFPALGWRGFAGGVVGATAVATLMQVFVTRFTAFGAAGADRLMLPNALTAAGIAPLALFLAFSLLPSGSRVGRAAVWGATAIIVFLILASKIRSQWLVMPLGIAVYLVLSSDWRRAKARRAAWTLAAAVCAAFLAAAATAWWWRSPRPNLATGALASGPEGVRSTALALLPARRHGVIRVRGTLTCRGTGEVFIRVRSSDATAQPSPVDTRGFLVAGAAPASVHMLVEPPSDSTRLFFDLEDPSNLGCTVHGLTVDRIQPRLLADLADRSIGWIERPPDPGAGSAPGPFGGDASIAFRFREMTAVLAAIRAGSPANWVFGHGLGATFALDTMGYNNRGEIVPFTQPNYIHNFYLFLPFKLGIIGTVEVLAALALCVWAAVHGARSFPPGASERRFLAAAAAAWVTYIAWSAAAPNILDFHMAPFWGVVVGLTASVMVPLRKHERPGSRPWARS